MSRLWQILSAVALALTVGPAFLVFAGSLTWRTHVVLMFAGAILWFATAPLWMEGTRAKRKRSARASRQASDNASNHASG